MEAIFDVPIKVAINLFFIDTTQPYHTYMCKYVKTHGGIPCQNEATLIK